MKSFVTHLLLGVSLFGSFYLRAQVAPAQAKPVAIRYREAYELSNIILALTPYGQSDPFEVYKNSRYYQQMRAYFAPYMQHPLLKQANYSRKEWDKYLAFRTDAYAFAFDAQGKLARQFAFTAQDDIHPFDDQLNLVNDFAQVSGFRAFYRSHQGYYDSLAQAYQINQRIPEMLAFLTAEFGVAQSEGQYVVVFSPLVYRLNCHREVQQAPTDFIMLPEYLLSAASQSAPKPADILTAVHVLFTETDHGFVNPTTEAYRTQVQQAFDPAKWDTGSGYDKDEFGTFNEYMTWAVYDLFAYHYFPKEAPLVCQNWAMQNESRGFFASRPFNEKLRQLYDKRKKGQTIRDLYPAMLAWCKQGQGALSQPTIASCSLQNATLTASSHAHYEVVFSEPMQEAASFDVLLKTSKSTSQPKRLEITKSANNLRWSDQGKKVSFDLDLENNCKNLVSLNAAWRTEIALRSKKGIDLKVYDSIIKTDVQVP